MFWSHFRILNVRMVQSVEFFWTVLILRWLRPTSTKPQSCYLLGAGEKNEYRSRSRLKKNKEPGPLKKRGAGVGKKLAGSPALWLMSKDYYYADRNNISIISYKYVVMIDSINVAIPSNDLKKGYIRLTKLGTFIAS